MFFCRVLCVVYVARLARALRRSVWGRGEWAFTRDGYHQRLTVPVGSSAETAVGRLCQAYEELRIEAGMAATPMGSLADEFKFFCPLCMCAENEPGIA